jgi:2-haloalkanoic acid dehalogenase type II
MRFGDPSVRKSRKVKAVIFDLGGTIIKTVEPAEVFKRILENNGVHIPLEKIRTAHRENETGHDADDMARQGMDYWVKWNRKILEKIGVKEERELLARRINDQWFDHAYLQVYPDAIEALERLKRRKFKLGVITNSLEEEIQKGFKKLELDGFFDVTVGCDTCGKAKPSREIFCCALDRLNVRPEDAVFVGDSLKFDYEGAEKAGMRPLLISRNGDAPSGVETITSLTEILEYVD